MAAIFHPWARSLLVIDRKHINYAFWLLPALVILMGIALGDQPIGWLLDEKAGQFVLYQIRLPRVLGSFLIGALLAGAGVLIQGVVRNPLADPGLIGISGGAAVAAAAFLWISSLWALPVWMLPLAAFVGAAIALWLVMTLARSKSGLSRSASGANVTLLVLAGVAINLCCNAMIGLLAYLSSDSVLRQISFWSMGSLGRMNWHWVMALFGLLIALAVYWPRHVRKLDALLLGDEQAAALGVDVGRLRNRAVLWVALMTAVSVSASGMIGFIGLVSPHIARMLCGAAHQRVLPMAVILGGCLLVTADMLSRTLIHPVELPIGIITTLVGAPVFIALLYRERARSW